jgi:hypothetical protein
VAFSSHTDVYLSPSPRWWCRFFLYIYWYVEVSSGLRSAIVRLNLEQDQVFAVDTWVVILVLSHTDRHHTAGHLRHFRIQPENHAAVSDAEQFHQ